MADQPDEDPRFVKAQEWLYNRLQLYMGKQLTPRTVKHVHEMVADFGRTMRLRGIDFPKCVALVLPRHGKILVVRANCTQQEVGIHLKSLTVAAPSVQPEELAEAVERAFPDYHKFLVMPRYTPAAEQETPEGS